MWIRTAEVLARAGISPNTISLFGMCAGIAAGASLAATFLAPSPWARILFVIAAALILLRLLCNMLDGMVAVATGRASPLGELFNEIPDRISDAATLIGFGYAAGSSPRLGYLSAVVAIFVAYVRAAARVAGAPQDYRGPMAKQQRMLVVILASLFLACSPAAWQPQIATDGWSVPIVALLIIIAGGVITAARRLTRAATVLSAPREPAA